MKTKYIKFRDGVVVVFNDTTIQHVNMARLLASPEDVVDAGFVYLAGDRFFTYGESVSLGVAHDAATGSDLDSAMKEGRLVVSPVRWLDTDFFYATTDGNGKVADITLLHESAIIGD